MLYMSSPLALGMTRGEPFPNKVINTEPSASFSRSTPKGFEPFKLESDNRFDLSNPRKV
jgi:hypothetical protein